MKAYLMHPDQDFSTSRELGNADDLRRDLELDTLLNTMAQGDEFLLKVATTGLLSPLTDAAEIKYRQAVLKDGLNHPDTLRGLYALALDAVQGERKQWGFHLQQSPDTILYDSLSVLTFFTSELQSLRAFTDAHRGEFESEALQRLCKMLSEELSDSYFAEVEGQLKTMRLTRGMLTSARLGTGNKGTDYVLRRPPELSWRERLGQQLHPGTSFDVHPRDEAGQRALSDLRNRSLNTAANALAQSADHIKSFYTMLLRELGFYVACLNLADAVHELGGTITIPDPVEGAQPRLHADELYEVSLALRLGTAVSGNTFDADDDPLILVTGANRGGKSTFLRSVGQAQLMLQAGMFVAARAFAADLRDRLFTHFKREEDDTMRSGKLDEELVRMDEIAGALTPRSEVLFNESFGSTNEREGSEIARQVTAALTEAGVKVVFVTHLFDFADSVRHDEHQRALFLRAPRGEDGQRGYRLVTGDPEPTSYGEDTYRQIFAVP